MTNRPTVLITGAAVRLGKATAHEFFNRGCNLMLHYNQSQTAAKALRDSFNQKRPESCQIIQADLSKNSSHQQLISACLKSFSRLDHLINNASVFYPTPISSSRSDTLLAFLTTNWQTPVSLIKQAQSELKKRQGSVVNLIDIYAQRGLSEHCFYVASKSALLASTRKLAFDLSPEIRVNGVSPGAILWPTPDSSKDVIDNTEKSKRQAIIQNTAIKKLGDAENIAKTISYLALDASYTTGSVVNVDGGRNDYI